MVIAGGATTYANDSRPAVSSRGAPVGSGERLVDCELPSNFLTIVAWTIGSESRADRGCFSVRHVVGDFVILFDDLGSTELELGPRYDESPVETGLHLC